MTMSRTAVKISLLAVFFLTLYFPVLKKMFVDWGIDPNYSHGYLVPFIAVYMLWSRRQRLAALEVKPSNWGLLLVGIGLVQLVLSWVGSEYFLQGTSIIITLLGCVLYLYGWKISWQTAIPILYLIFMVPLPAIIWNQIAFPLKLYASSAAARLINALGYTVLREGNILTLPNITLEVADACSGLRSLTSLLALSALLAYLAENSGLLKKMIIFLSAVPIAIVCNIFRLTATAVLARHFGTPVAEGFIHEFSGIVVFVLGLAMLAGVYILINRKRKI